MNTSLSLVSGVLGVALAFAASPAQAHIKMLKPTSWIVEDNGINGSFGGNPQKSGPCGPGSSDNPTLTNVITPFMAGETITVQWTETTLHPGYFRIALVENRADLKDPTLSYSDANCNVDHSKVPTGPHDNVLADGILLTNNASTRPGTPNFSYQVKLPNKPCEKCTLQLIQFMESHPAGCIYYHCADIKIAAPGSNPGADAGVTVPEDGGADASTTPSDAGTASTGDAAVSRSDAGSASGTTDSGLATGGSSGGSTGAPAGGGAVAPVGSPSDDDGCSVSFSQRKPAAGWSALSMLALGLLAMHRRRQRN